MRDRKVQQITTHIGIRVPGEVKNSLDAKINHVDMDLWPMGVRIQGKDPHGEPYEMLVPFANIQYMRLITEKPQNPEKNAPQK